MGVKPGISHLVYDDVLRRTSQNLYRILLGFQSRTMGW